MAVVNTIPRDGGPGRNSLFYWAHLSDTLICQRCRKSKTTLRGIQRHIKKHRIRPLSSKG